MFFSVKEAYGNKMKREIEMEGQKLMEREMEASIHRKWTEEQSRREKMGTD